MKRIAVGSALVVILALAGCGSASAPQAGGPVETFDDAPAASATKAPAKKDAVKSWLKSNYKGVPWVKHVRYTHKIGDIIWVETDLSDHAFSTAQPLCVATSSYEIHHGGKFTGVEVRAKSGARLIRRIDFGDPCAGS